MVVGGADENAVWLDAISCSSDPVRLLNWLTLELDDAVYRMGSTVSQFWQPSHGELEDERGSVYFSIELNILSQTKHAKTIIC